MTRTSEAVQQLGIWLQWCCWPLPDVNGWSSRLVPLKKLDDAHENDTKMTPVWKFLGSGFEWCLKKWQPQIQSLRCSVSHSVRSKRRLTLELLPEKLKHNMGASDLPCRANRNGKPYGKPMASHMKWLISSKSIPFSMAPSLPVSLMLKMFTLSSCDSSLTVALGLHLGKKLDLGIWMKFFLKSTNFQILQWKIGPLQLSSELSGCLKLWKFFQWFVAHSYNT